MFLHESWVFRWKHFIPSTYAMRYKLCVGYGVIIILPSEAYLVSTLQKLFWPG